MVEFKLAVRPLSLFSRPHQLVDGRASACGDDVGKHGIMAVRFASALFKLVVRTPLTLQCSTNWWEVFISVTFLWYTEYYSAVV